MQMHPESEIASATPSSLTLPKILLAPSMKVFSKKEDYGTATK